MQFRFPLELFRTHGLRYNKSVRWRFFTESTISEHPISTEYVCADEGIKIKLDGRVDEWPPIGIKVADKEGDLHPDAAEVDAACSLHGLEPGGFGLYAGNLDRYQDLTLLRDAAALLPDRIIVAATHHKHQRDLAPLRVVAVNSASETRALTHGAALAVAPRRRSGGFPIKLLNYMEAGRAIVAREGQAHTLVHGCNALLVDRGADAAHFAEAVESLFRDPERAATLGHAAYATARSEHDWGAIARRTLALAQHVSTP